MTGSQHIAKANPVSTVMHALRPPDQIVRDNVFRIRIASGFLRSASEGNYQSTSAEPLLLHVDVVSYHCFIKDLSIFVWIKSTFCGCGENGWQR